MLLPELDEKTLKLRKIKLKGKFDSLPEITSMKHYFLADGWTFRDEYRKFRNDGQPVNFAVDSHQLEES